MIGGVSGICFQTIPSVVVTTSVRYLWPKCAQHLSSQRLIVALTAASFAWAFVITLSELFLCSILNIAHRIFQDADIQAQSRMQAAWRQMLRWTLWLSSSNSPTGTA
ncbi:hypothetical protein CUR178_03848 [Leishmania enriettii]|uniref:Uncharacterized protein n=1 Tax=Leishmania enriettii TaxID=5663 RepID=A0A836KN57_LEIEN|nr:hypothetical protein CUR178_03848 [Leishmania enriettii]